MTNHLPAIYAAMLTQPQLPVGLQHEIVRLAALGDVPPTVIQMLAAHPDSDPFIRQQLYESCEHGMVIDPTVTTDQLTRVATSTADPTVLHELASRHPHHSALITAVVNNPTVTIDQLNRIMAQPAPSRAARDPIARAWANQITNGTTPIRADASIDPYLDTVTGYERAVARHAQHPFLVRLAGGYSTPDRHEHVLSVFLTRRPTRDETDDWIDVFTMIAAADPNVAVFQDHLTNQYGATQSPLGAVFKLAADADSSGRVDAATARTDQIDRILDRTLGAAFHPIISRQVLYQLLHNPAVTAAQTGRIIPMMSHWILYDHVLTDPQIDDAVAATIMSYVCQRQWKYQLPCDWSPNDPERFAAHWDPTPNQAAAWAYTHPTIGPAMIRTATIGQLAAAAASTHNDTAAHQVLTDAVIRAVGNDSQAWHTFTVIAEPDAPAIGTALAARITTEPDTTAATRA